LQGQFQPLLLFSQTRMECPVLCACGLQSGVSLAQFDQFCNQLSFILVLILHQKFLLAPKNSPSIIAQFIRLTAYPQQKNAAKRGLPGVF
jgi:hypothetical protein